MPVVRLENVSKDYLPNGAIVHAVREVSLEVGEGQFVALVGRSGCGKSTLLNLAGAMDFPTSGRVLLDGVDTSTLDDGGLTRIRREKVGFVFQSFQLFPTLTVLENVELPLLLAAHGRAESALLRPFGAGAGARRAADGSGIVAARRAARDRLASVGLEGLDDRFPHQLSGGQMQRVAIARALVHSPRVLLADEPTGNLDTATGNAILDLLRRLPAGRGSAVIMATHSQEAAAMADVVVRMRDGRVEGTGPR